jgi:hypothetical protein
VVDANDRLHGCVRSQATGLGEPQGSVVVTGIVDVPEMRAESASLLRIYADPARFALEPELTSRALISGSPAS